MSAHSYVCSSAQNSTHLAGQRKKEGPDGLTFDLMRQLPEEGLSALTFLYQRIEAAGLRPSSLQHVVNAPLNFAEERKSPSAPNSLLSALYRLRGKMWAYLVKRRLKRYRDFADWHIAVPETTVFDCAGRRQFLAEVSDVA